jgi:BirA family transcriptional regulator, biotin operon repressor / biotin---[acetyl-CoA-carboxylase] ligase
MLNLLNNSSSQDKLDPAKINNKLKTLFIGRNIVLFDTIDSTNKAAKKMADKGAKEGTLVIAEEQTKGKGRMSRSWHSPSHSNILMSLIFRPELPPAKIFYLTMISSIALVSAIKKTTGLETMIKWPNDIYYNNKKLAGILTELRADQGKISHAVVGIGLNVNFDPAENDDIKKTATSLYKESEQKLSRNELLIIILQEIEREYSLLKQFRFEKIRRKWNKHSLILGKPVIIFSDNYKEEGTALSIADDGALILVKDNGEKKRIICGDVSLRLKQ